MLFVSQLQNPYLVDPAFRFGTIPFGNTEAVLRDNKPEMYAYMKRFNRSTVNEGIAAVKERFLILFITISIPIVRGHFHTSFLYSDNTFFKLNVNSKIHCQSMEISRFTRV